MEQDKEIRTISKDRFLTGGKEMEQLIRNFNWTNTSLGPILMWPQSLRTAINIALHSPVPTLILWGREMIRIYNEPYSRLLGNRHPQLLGSKLTEFPAEEWMQIEQKIESVFLEGVSGHEESQSVIKVNEDSEDHYFSLHYNPVYNESGDVGGVYLTVEETTPIVETRKQIEENEERLRMAIESTKLGTWDYNPVTGDLGWSSECRAIYGFPSDKVIDFQVFSDHIHPDDKIFALTEIRNAMDPGGSGQYDIRYRILRFTDHSTRWIHATGKVYFNQQRKADRFICTVIDITESRELELALRENEQRTRLAVEAAQLGTFDWNMKTNNFIYSDRLANIYGYTDTHNLDHESISGMIHPEDKAIREIALERAINSGLLFYEVRVVHPDNSVHWIRVNGKVLFDEEGSPDQMYGAVMDITEHKSIIRELEESEKRFKTLADTAPVMIWTSGTDRLCDFFSKGWLDFTGRTLEEEIGKGWMNSIHPDDLALCTDIYDSAFAAQKKFSIEYRLRRHDGKYRWITDEGTPRFSSNGTFLGFIGSCLDIQERKMAREELERKVLERTSELNKRNSELQQQKEFVDTILESSVDVIAVLDTELRYVTLNRSACEYYKVKKETMIGKKIVDVYPLIKISGMYDDLKEALTGTTVHAPNYKSTVLDKHFENFYIPLKNRNNEVYGVLLVSHDNTAIVQSAQELVSTNRKLEEKNLALERSNKELESFSYVASHDLQEPLRKIRTFAELVQKNLKDEEAAKRYFAKIDSSAQRMADLIKAVLNYSRLSKKEKHFEETNLNEILRNVKSDFELSIEEKHVQIKSNKLPVIMGIPLQLNQLFSNLIGNSIKFSKENPVISIISRIIDPKQMPVHPDIIAEKRYVELIFKDNGIGFEQQYSDQIFTIFKRLHGNDSYSGTGIGLALCKKIVENHFGFIAVQSIPGKGTEFYIYLPMLNA